MKIFSSTEIKQNKEKLKKEKQKKKKYMTPKYLKYKKNYKLILVFTLYIVDCNLYNPPELNIKCWIAITVD